MGGLSFSGDWVGRRWQVKVAGEERDTQLCTLSMAASFSDNDVLMEFVTSSVLQSRRRFVLNIILHLNSTIPILKSRFTTRHCQNAILM